MHIIKLALALAGVAMAGQALAHKASHLSSAPSSAIRLAPAQTDTNPAALLGGIAGRSAAGITSMPALAPPAAPAKSTETSTHITHRH
jgi:hypothetical protein